MTITKRNNRSVKQGSMSSSKALKHEALCSHENSLSGSSWSKGCTPLCRTNALNHGCGLQRIRGCRVAIGHRARRHRRSRQSARILFRRTPPLPPIQPCRQRRAPF
jgi:hypothetical protein